MKLALIGATGLVGREMIEVLSERDIPIDEFIPVASHKSIGKEVKFNGKSYHICSIDDAIAKVPDVALFSAGGETSKIFAPKFAAVGTRVIDNSSAWRMEPDIKLVVPEVNGEVLGKDDKIIANPNCSTIQLVVALRPLNRKYGIKRLVISTYQSFTGTGVKAVDQYHSERTGAEDADYAMAYPHPIFENCLPHCDVFLENDYTKEEMKLVNETRKILGDDKIAITATAVRVPVHGGHSESVNVEFNSAFDIEEARQLMKEQSGLVVQDDPSSNIYPMPKYSRKKDEVFVGRIRRDESVENGLNMWVVADNLRKGAATNAVQILEYCLSKGI